MYVRDCSGSPFFSQHPQPQPLLLPQSLHPQPHDEKSMMKIRRRMIHQQLFPSKQELHIIIISFKDVFEPL
jgi:hypothetical protein